MKRQKKRIIGILLSFTLLCSLSVTGMTSGRAVAAGATEVTRLEWLKALTEAFEMSVTEDNYPDNYYSDVDSSSKDYHDIMLATEFGLVDVEAGDPLRPDEPATREFVAHTLNLCMGYLPEENITYTFSEASNVSYPDDIQICVNAGWIELVNGSFLPQQGITTVEKNRMITVAKAEVAATTLDENHENQYEVLKGVIVVPEETKVLLTDEGELTFYDYSGRLSAGDIFVVFSDGLPIARKAVNVTQKGSETIVAVEGVEAEEAFSTLDVQGIIKADLSQTQVIDEDVSLAYIVGGSEERGYEDGITFYSLQEAEEQTEEITAVIATKKITIPTTSNGGISTYGIMPLLDEPAPGNEALSINCKISNVSAEWNADVIRASAYAKIKGKVTFSFSVGTDNIEIPYFENPFVKIPVGVVGYVKPTAEGTAKGSISLCLKGNMEIGVKYEHGQVRMIFGFQKESFTIQAEVEADFGVKIAAGIDVAVLKAELYAKTGAKASAKITSYRDSQLPSRCTHLTAHMYASAGAKASFNLLGYRTNITLVVKEWIKEENSPVKVALHYEDGKPVALCTRDNGAGSDGNGSGGSSSSGSTGSAKMYKYYTPIYSQYAYSGLNTGVSAAGDPYSIFEYLLNSDGEATITKYNGNMAALNIPSTLDGHTVVGIGASVFKNNNKIMIVTMPDTIRTISSDAFGNCKNLEVVTLSKGLKEMGAYAFYNCDALTSIEIPKSLIKTTDAYINAYEYGYKYGVFHSCDNLKEITFESGTTTIANGLFRKCSGLERIIIPNTVTTIQANAFQDCTNLRNVVIGNSVTSIGVSAFTNDIGLTEIEIPDNVTTISSDAFGNCTNLKKVTLSKGLKEMGAYAFYNCDALTCIEIPKSLVKTTDAYINAYEYDYKYGVFHSCDNLKEITFESGTTTIANGLFRKCSGLERITIPNTVTTIQEKAFQDCENLKNIVIGNSVTSIGVSAFTNDIGLTEIKIPDSVITISSDAFGNCTNLKKVTLSKGLKEMGAYAFYNCDALTSIEIPKSLVKTTDAYIYAYEYDYKYGVFHSCDGLKEVTFEPGIKTIPIGLFRKCNGLEEITIPNTVTVIESYAFQGCKNLKKVKLCDGLECISGYVFNECSALVEVNIPDTVTTMGNYVFAGCTSLNNIKLSNILQSINEGTFKACTCITNITIPDSVTAIRKNAFQGSGLTEIVLPVNVTTIEANAFQNSANLAQVEMGDKVTSIGNYAFQNCDALTAITIPSSVTTLGTYAFENCEVMENVAFGSGLTKIDSYTFNLCPALKKIVLPYGMKTISSNAFTNCTNLTELTIPITVTNIASNAFSYPSTMTVYGVSGTYAQEWANSVGATFVEQRKPAESVTLDRTSLTVNKGTNTTLVMTVTPRDFTDEVVWKSNNTDVVTVSEKGVVTAKGVGAALIRVTVGNVSASCSVTVQQPVTGISLNKSSYSMEANASYALIATVSPSSAYDKTITWSSSDETVAAVDQNGIVTGLKKGTAVIKATANDGSNVSRSCTITVTNNFYQCDTVEFMESPHNYEDNCKDAWIYCLAGEEKIAVTFDDRTKVEDGFDYLYLYDGTGNEIGKYTGSALAGQTILITGDTVKLKMDSDGSGNAWGFKVTKVEAYCEHTYATEWSSDDDFHWHAATCKHTDQVKDKAEHVGGDWIVDVAATEQADGTKHRECMVCGKVLQIETIPQLGKTPAQFLEERLETAVADALEASASLSEDMSSATPEEKQQVVSDTLAMVQSACQGQNISELGLVPADKALAYTEQLGAVEERIGELLGTSVTVVHKDGAQTFALPTVENALLSVPAGENAFVKVAEVESPVFDEIEEQTVTAMTLELFDSEDEKLSLYVPVVVVLQIPATVDAEKEIIVYHFKDGESAYVEKISVVVDKGANTITFVVGSFSTFVIANAPDGVSVSGTVTSFKDEATQTTVRILEGNGSEVARSIVTGKKASYCLDGILPGVYTLEISKPSHVTRKYSIVVENESVEQDAEIWLIGDVSGDGKINARDKKVLFNHIAGTSVLTDYAFTVGDVSGDGKINARDKKVLFNHIAGTSLLW